MSMLCLVFAAIATAAQAQQAADSFDQLRGLVDVGDTVTVSDTLGQRITGAIAAVSSSALELQVGNTRRNFSEADVRSISQRRHGDVARGTRRGFFIGEGIAVVSAVACAAVDDCAVNWWLVAFGGAGGAGIGATVSALRTREHVVYVKPVIRSTTFRISPLVTDDRKGVFVVLRF